MYEIYSVTNTYFIFSSRLFNTASLITRSLIKVQIQNWTEEATGAEVIQYVGASYLFFPSFSEVEANLLV